MKTETAEDARLTVVIGNGAIGHQVTALLTARGERVRIAQRRPPQDLPAGVEYAPCDVLQLETVRRAVRGATHVLLAVGFTYDARVWKDTWPDFYGPGVVVSHLGQNAFGALAAGKRALLIAPPDTPHDFAYAPDIARAVVPFLAATVHA